LGGEGRLQHVECSVDIAAVPLGHLPLPVRVSDVGMNVRRHEYLPLAAVLEFPLGMNLLTANPTAEGISDGAGTVRQIEREVQVAEGNLRNVQPMAELLTVSLPQQGQVPLLAGGTPVQFEI
jgi:hypothetical protein